MHIKILACQIIGPAAAGSAGPVPTAVLDTPDTLFVGGIPFRYRLYRMQLNQIVVVLMPICCVFKCVGVLLHGIRSVYFYCSLCYIPGVIQPSTPPLQDGDCHSIQLRL